MNGTRICNCCGKSGPIAKDETDAGPDEMVIDSLGLCRRNLYCCGACLDAALDAAEKELQRHESNEAAIQLERGVVDGD